jgi:hypothetical protein
LDELAVAVVQARVYRAVDSRCSVLVDEPFGEQMVPAGMVEVVMGVEGEHVAAGQCLGRLPDIADAQTRVDQGSSGIALDQEAVHMHRLADEIDPGFQFPGGEPVGHWVISPVSERSVSLRTV